MCFSLYLSIVNGSHVLIDNKILMLKNHLKFGYIYIIIKKDRFLGKVFTCIFDK